MFDVKIDWQALNWEAADEKDVGYWIASLSLDGYAFHVEAICVDNESEPQVAFEPRWQEYLDNWAVAAQPDGHWETLRLEFDGAEYDCVVFLSPFC